jgi:hypothetical protein
VSLCVFSLRPSGGGVVVGGVAVAAVAAAVVVNTLPVPVT